jgi:hypothetical protein
MIQRAWSVIAIAAACGGNEAPIVAIDRVTPPYAPLAGGTRVSIEGVGFDHPPNRVIVAGVAAPVAYAASDARLDFVVPAGERPGDAELFVANELGNVTAVGVFRYSEPPSITGVVPDRIVATALPATITLVGRGFADEAAGRVQVLLDGVPLDAADFTVASDSELRFTAKAGPALARPSIELINDRGSARLERGHRVVPGDRGLLLFPASNQSFAVFVDPMNPSLVMVPHQSPFTTRFSTVAIDESGDLVGIDRQRRLIGRIDLRTHQLVDPVAIMFWLPTMVRAHGVYYAIDRASLRFGIVDPASGTFTPVGTSQVPCCGSYGLAFDGATMYVVSRGGGLTIATIDLATGAFGSGVTLTAPASFHVEEMRFLDGTLYATSRDGTVATIDPVTGTVTVLPITVGRALAMEVLD